MDLNPYSGVGLFLSLVMLVLGRCFFQQECVGVALAVLLPGFSEILKRILAHNAAIATGRVCFAVVDFLLSCCFSVWAASSRISQIRANPTSLALLFDGTSICWG